MDKSIESNEKETKAINKKNAKTDKLKVKDKCNERNTEGGQMQKQTSKDTIAKGYKCKKRQLQMNKGRGIQMQ